MNVDKIQMSEQERIQAKLKDEACEGRESPVKSAPVDQDTQDTSYVSFENNSFNAMPGKKINKPIYPAKNPLRQSQKKSSYNLNV